jgi:transcriptional regulator with XRE-family HTH domain
MSVLAPAPGVGELLREWRRRRRLSQLDVSLDAAVSARHLSFVETGRSKPSRELVLHLAEHLDVPLRERNALLLAAGYAPAYRETPLDAAAMAPVRAALDKILAGHEPFPALIVDRRWDVVSANSPALALMTDGVAPALLEPPINAMEPVQHARDVRHRARHHGLRARDRVVLPGRLGDRGRAARPRPRLSRGRIVSCRGGMRRCDPRQRAGGCRALQRSGSPGGRAGAGPRRRAGPRELPRRARGPTRSRGPGGGSHALR